MKQYILPMRVVLSEGRVSGEDNLFHDQPLQTGIGIPLVTVLKKAKSRTYILLDFGKELHGGLRVITHSVVGQSIPQVRFTFGESVGEAMSELGENNATNDHSPRDFVYPIPPLSDLELGQTGFRFVKIELMTENTEIQFRALRAAFSFTPLERKGELITDDPLVNQIYETAAYTCFLNIQNGYIWDGIKRDRLVWLGDLNPELLTIAYVYGDIENIRNSLDYSKENTPLPDWINNIPAYSMWWIINQFDYYMRFGDIDYLRSNYPYIEGIVLQLAGCLDKNNEIDILKNKNNASMLYFIDWPTESAPCEKDGFYALYLICMDRVSRICDILGERGEIPEIASRRRKRPAHGFFGKKQVAALSFLVGEISAESAYAEISEGGARGYSTFMAYYILSGLAECGGAKEAVSAMKEYFGGMLARGATTFWEDFDIQWLEGSGRIDEPTPKGKKDIHGDFGAYCYKGFRHSLCHGWASGAVPFLTECALGIRIMEPGYRKVCILPMDCGLKHIKGSIPTPYGDLKVEHFWKDGAVKTSVRVPEGIEILCDSNAK